MVQGFKEFILKGNLIEIAVAFIMASAFATVVTTFTAVLLGFVGKVGGQPDFSEVTLFDVKVGLFLNALVAFLVIGFVVYFFVVVPYNKLLERTKKEEPPAALPDDVLLLQEIRDLLASRPQV
jgi:large conductance mechanosensitive channel